MPYGHFCRFVGIAIVAAAATGTAAWVPRSTASFRHGVACGARATPTTASPYLSAEFVGLDVQLDANEIGRLVVQLTIPSLLPQHAEQFIQLCRQDLTSIDPSASYIGCEFDYSSDYIQEFDNGNGSITKNGRYRWSHVVRGRASRRPPIVDAASQRQCTNAVYGGQYYGDKYQVDTVNDNDISSMNTPDVLSFVDSATSPMDTNELPPYRMETVQCGILLTVPVAGPGYGSSRFALVRVGESPPEWGERLLLNSGVIGRLVSGHDTVQRMATSRMVLPVAPKIVATTCWPL